ncbi:NnrU family protein [Thalassococcus sp. CAU 1522]|uniref:NnrU family protein n=1 Tax=Thalassococcus arenae TaxID=2851652 RepID=A0ABS6N8V2_9RHOB|nr:NnrU family protein [Thalassococcus arenae]MBV2360238.1 NnrU family protein [Thalassococcus arenae]
MLLLILGLLIWSAAHLFKRVAPDRRAAMGDKGRGIVTLGIFAGLALMILGYRMADGAFFWGRHPAMVGINNLLMLFSVYLFAASGLKTAITARIRHPQLTAVKVWALAHILVNGDMPSLVLFGGLLAWAVAEVIVINKQTEWVRPQPPFARDREIKAIVGTVIVYAILSGAHYLLGYPAFG